MSPLLRAEAEEGDRERDQTAAGITLEVPHEMRPGACDQDEPQSRSSPRASS